MASYATCDIQMLRGQSGEYVLKEFAVFEPTDVAQVYKAATFAPPYAAEFLPEKYVKQNSYGARHLHGLRWDDGDLSYEQLPRILYEMTRQYKVLYVKGEDKKKILQFFLPTKDVYNIEMLDCPKLRKLPLVWAPCANDAAAGCHSKHNCAERNAKRIGLWLESYLYTNVSQ